MKNVIVKATSVLMVMLLSCFIFVSCGDNENENTDDTLKAYTADTTLGNGSTTFTLEVENATGNVITFTINTDEKTLADALLAEKLIAGEDSQYGLYVKTVNGITYDYETDGLYWALYADGEYSMVGASSLQIENGHTYKFKAE